MSTMVKIKTKRCIHCGENGIIEIPQEDFDKAGCISESLC